MLVLVRASARRAWREIDELCALKIGADDFIRKPFSQRVLLERVKATLRRAMVKDSYKDGYGIAFEMRAVTKGDLEQYPCSAFGGRFAPWPATARCFARCHTVSTRERTQGSSPKIAGYFHRGHIL